jgi:DNA-nicking Smr family endonuclease
MKDEPLRRRRQRRLSDAERILWSEVTRDIAPFRPRVPTKQDTTIESQASPPPVAKSKPKPQRASRSLQTASERTQPPLAPLGRRMRQRIARGSHALGGRLDLHGLTQREAHDRLIGFLRTAQARGETLVLVITGKGAPLAETGHERGVLKRQVPHWLRLPALRELVVGFEPAHVAHGGEGALYVRVRRKRAPE